MSVKPLNTEEFKETVLDNELPVLVDFWAAWCGPCRMIAPVIEEISNEYGKSVFFAKVNVDDEMELAAAYGVQTIPTLILFKNGEETGRLIGVRPKEEILSFIGL